MQEKRKSRLTEDAMFQMVMKDPQCLKHVRTIIEWATDRKVESLKLIGNELKEVVGDDLKSVRFDVLFEGEKTKYDIEMQNYTKRDLVRRSRYYHSIIDVISTMKGMNYENMSNTILIYILTFDYKGYNEPITVDLLYSKGHFEKPVDEGRMTIYMNATAKSNNKELNAFYEFLMTNNVTTSMTEDLKALIMKSSKSPELRKTEMNLWEIEEDAKERGFAKGMEEGLAQGVEKGMHQGMQQGIQQGMEQGKEYLVLNMIKNGASAEQIAKLTGENLEWIENLVAKSN